MRFARTVSGVAAVVGLLVTAGCSTGVDGTATPESAEPAAPTVLIVDASQSMTTSDAPGPRIDAAKKAAISLVEDLPSGTEFGLVSYGAGVDASPAEHTAGCRDISVLRPLKAVDVEAARSAIACDWTMNPDGDLVEIAPRGRTVRTVDGIGSGSTVGEAREYYGDPTSDTKNPDGSRTVVFAESSAGEAGYRMTVDGDGDDGVIRTIVICHCVVRTLDPCSGASGTCRYVADADVDGDGTADAIGVAVNTVATKVQPSDRVVTGQGEVEVRVSIGSRVRSITYRLSGSFYIDPADMYSGAFGLSRSPGADVVVYLVHAEGPPDSFGVVGWNGSDLIAVPSPVVMKSSLDPSQWWIGDKERRRTIVTCRTAPEIAVDELQPQQDRPSLRTTTTYRFSAGKWSSTKVDSGEGPRVEYGSGPDKWDAGKKAFACRDLGTRR